MGSGWSVLSHMPLYPSSWVNISLIQTENDKNQTSVIEREDMNINVHYATFSNI